MNFQLCCGRIVCPSVAKGGCNGREKPLYSGFPRRSKSTCSARGGHYRPMPASKAHAKKTARCAGMKRDVALAQVSGRAQMVRRGVSYLAGKRARPTPATRSPAFMQAAGDSVCAAPAMRTATRSIGRERATGGWWGRSTAGRPHRAGRFRDSARPFGPGGRAGAAGRRAGRHSGPE